MIKPAIPGVQWVETAADLDRVEFYEDMAEIEVPVAALGALGETVAGPRHHETGYGVTAHIALEVDRAANPRSAAARVAVVELLG